MLFHVVTSVLTEKVATAPFSGSELRYPPPSVAPRGADTGRRRSLAASNGALQLGRPKGTYEALLWLEGLGRTRTFEHLRLI